VGFKGNKWNNCGYQWPAVMVKIQEGITQVGVFMERMVNAVLQGRVLRGNHAGNKPADDQQTRYGFPVSDSCNHDCFELPIGRASLCPKYQGQYHCFTHDRPWNNGSSI